MPGPKGAEYTLSILSRAGRYKETQETDTQGEEGRVMTETETGVSHLQARSSKD